jgi:hypothetical protein
VPAPNTDIVSIMVLPNWAVSASYTAWCGLIRPLSAIVSRIIWPVDKTSDAVGVVGFEGVVGNVDVFFLWVGVCRWFRLFRDCHNNFE